MTDARMERYREGIKKLRTPDEIRRFIDDPARDPELAKELADTLRVLRRIVDFYDRQGRSDEDPRHTET